MTTLMMVVEEEVVEVVGIEEGVVEEDYREQVSSRL